MKRALACALICAFPLCGCASKYGAQQTSVNYYPACYQPLADLRSSEHSEAVGTAAGGLIGALGGALVGLLASGGKWQGAAIGGAVGGAAGTMAGNVYARRQQEADNNRRMAAYMQNLDGDISNLDIASAAARTSLQCYDRQFAQLLAAIKSRQIAREAAAARYAEISSGREEAIRILGEGAAQGRDIARQYEQAFNQEEEILNQTPPQQQRNAAASRSNLAAAKNKQKALAKKSREMEEQKSQAQGASTRQTKEINEALADLEDIRA